MQMDRMNRVECIKDSQQISFLLAGTGFGVESGQNMFYQPALRIMQHPDVTCLVPCTLSEMNGRLRLSYQTAGYRSVRDIMLTDPRCIFQIALGLADVMKKIDDIGFLCAANFRWAPDEIMADKNSMNIYMIYLPLQPEGIAVNPEILKNCLKDLLVQCVQVNQQLYGSSMGRTLIQAVQGAESLEALEKNIRQLAARVKEKEAEAAREAARQRMAAQAQLQESDKEGDKKEKRGLWPFGKRKDKAVQLMLTGLDKAGSCCFLVGEQELIVGKSPEKSQLIVDFPRISRKHCAIKAVGGTCYIMDMESTNGTFINGRRLAPLKWEPAAVGSEIRLADVSFMVRKQGETDDIARVYPEID